jgi:hypothetical protein
MTALALFAAPPLAPPGAPPLAAALTDAGLLLIAVVGAVAIVAFLLFVVREALNRPVEIPRELPPPHDLPAIEDDPMAAAEPGATSPKTEAGERSDRPPAIGG